ncbi:MAG: DMT family transporter [Saprospiraceae bacterium]
MWILILCIILNAFIGVIFKYFKKYSVDNFQAIVINYFVCVLTAAIFSGASPIPPDLMTLSWFPYALILGIVFIIVFNLMALTVQYFDIMIATVFQKMSMIAPTIFAIGWYHETSGWMKWLGIFFAICAILLLTYQKHQNQESGAVKQYLIFPILTFLGSCFIDSMLFYVEREGLVEGSKLNFTSTLFLFAGISGIAIFVIQSLKTRPTFAWKNVIGGICLGIPNFFSIYLLLLALQQGLDGSVVFPVNNIGILVTATMLGVIIFRERLNRPKMIGFGLAIVSIVLIALA